MNGRLAIVEGCEIHVRFLSVFGRDSFIDAYRHILPMEDLLAYTEEAFAETAIRREIRDPSALYFVIGNESATPCGYSKLVVTPPPDPVGGDRSIELQRLYIHANQRGKGAGAKLLQHGEKRARTDAFRSIWLRVWEGNSIARGMYLKQGYSVVGDEPYRVGAEERTVILMEKSLI